MNKGQLYYGSINYDKLISDLREGKLKTFKTEKGKRLINVNVYITQEPNEYGNHGSISVPYKDEYVEDKKKNLYIGSLKLSQPSIEETGAEDFKDIEDDLPF